MYLVINSVNVQNGSVYKLEVLNILDLLFLVIILHGVGCGMERFLRLPPEMNSSDLDQKDLAGRWRRLRETMELYLRLNMADSDEKEQCKAFQYIIGQDGRDIYSTMTFTSSEEYEVDALFANFEDYCKPKKNVIMERYKFNARTQQKDETANQYVAELKLIAKNCNFGSLEDELIRDRLVYRTNSERAKERLLRKEELTDFTSSFKDLSCGRTV